MEVTHAMPRYAMNLDHLAEVTAYVTAPTPVGPSSWGTRLLFPVVGGTVKGQRLNGKVQSFGADWGVIRPDDCFELDVRIVVETDDGAFIHTQYAGIADMTKEGAGGSISRRGSANGSQSVYDPTI